ncbi:lon protease homolog 2, peroxisomal-like [Ischnura elegans]|uniref:lon protease homolog 2, peroxisomal-like n=1 Tax=Ischnura elegans TaxID=197161 RepID=UPI001ED8A509|nr:lon protease homolog 2, peroxisomal-like [Ischnura elegans]
MAPSVSIPRKLPLLVISDEVLFPGASKRLSVTSSRNINMIRNRLRQNTLASTIIGVIPREPGNDTDVGPDDLGILHPIGTAAMVVQVTGTNWPVTNYTVLVTGICRFRLEKVVMEEPYVVGVVTQLDKFTVNEVNDENPELNELIENFRNELTKLIELSDASLPIVGKLRRMIDSIPGHNLADVYSQLLKASYSEKLELLDAIDLTDRFQKALHILLRHVESIQNKKKQQHSFILGRRPVNEIISSGGKDEDEISETDEIHELQAKLRKAGLPPLVRKVAFKELQRLKRISPSSPEDGIIRSYIELIADLPWSRSSKETIDIQKARKDLDADHYAMDKLKRRVLEYLAVRQLKNSLRGPILCFVGPPGVGKTSVGRSIAHTLGREFQRISLGGVCNQSDIRGHRRTYIGSMAGRIIQGLKTAGVNNPVFLLDEVDKMCAGVHGDPAAALLEVLDPEQNCHFVDHYLNVPFDLSQVMFIATANTLDSIPAPLLDRMEVIRVPGYTHEEKLHIAMRHLLPKQLEEHGLTKEVMSLPEESIKMLITKYTREAGVRTLERKLGALCRAVAVRVAERQSPSQASKEGIGWNAPIVLDEAALEDILGPPPYDSYDSWLRAGQEAGLAVGLAWTAAGGEVLLVEATQYEGDGQLVLTGQLGDVMKESAKLALNWVRTHAHQYGLLMDSLGGHAMSHTDVHIHFPAGAVGKDGPSAGITIVVALVSLFTGRPMASETAMTGELTLHGDVLPVGGIKEKVLAAHRAGLKRIILPRKCEKALLEIPESVKKDLVFIPVSSVDEVLQAAFDGGWNAKNENITLTSKL